MICQAAIDLIKSFESLHDGDLTQIGLQPKMCPAGVWTVGYGRALQNESKTRFLIGDKDKAQALAQYPNLTEKAAEIMLAEDLEKFEAAVNKLVKKPLNQNQRGALVSFTYNVGTQALANSTLLALLNAGDYKNAAEQLLRWNKAGGKVLKGLTRRREAERELFLTAV